MSEASIVSIERLKSLVNEACEAHNKQHGDEYDPDSIAYRFERIFISKELTSKADPMTMTSWEEDFNKAWSEREEAFLFMRKYITCVFIMAIFKDAGKADNTDKNLKYLACRFAFSIIPPLAKHYGFNFIHTSMRPLTITYGYEDGDDITIEVIDFTTMLRKDIDETYCEWTEAEIERTTIEKITEGDVEDPEWVEAEYEKSCEAAAKFFEEEEFPTGEDLREFWAARYSRHPQMVSIIRAFDSIFHKKLNELDKEFRAMLASKFMEIGNQGQQGK